MGARAGTQGGSKRNDTHPARRVAHSHIRHNCETIALSAQMSSMSDHRRVPWYREAIMSEVVTYIHSHGRIGSTEVQSSACEGGGAPRRSRRSLSLSDAAASAAADIVSYAPVAADIVSYTPAPG